MIIEPGAQGDFQIGVTVQIATGENTPFATRRAVEVFRQLAEIVDGIIKGVEAEANRIFAI